MIGYLKGVILEKHPPQLLLDVNGVGYELQASMNTFYHLPEVGESTSLYTHLVVREDAHVLYAFYKESERALFRSLIKVNGVGPKIALTILSSMDADTFLKAITQESVSLLTHIPGVGKKTAERLIIEMRDRLKDLPGSMKLSDMSVLDESIRDASQDAISALVALGYKPAEAGRVVSKVAKPEMKSEELIRQALKQMAF